MSATKWDESPTPGRPVEVDFKLTVKAIQNIDAREQQVAGCLVSK